MGLGRGGDIVEWVWSIMERRVWKRVVKRIRIGIVQVRIGDMGGDWVVRKLSGVRVVVLRIIW